MDEHAAIQKRTHDILVIGDVNPDIIVNGDDPTPVFGQVEKFVDSTELVIGGSASITACGAARLGLRTALVGVVGDDALGKFITAAVASRGVDLSGLIVDSDRPTGASVLLNRGADRAILTSVGTISALRVNDIPARLLDDVRHLHLAAYFLQTTARADLPTLFADVKKRGVTTSFDCNWDPNQDWTGIDDLLHHTDVFFLNEQEAMAITGHHDVLDAAKELLKRGPQVVAVHCGARGATVVSGDGDVHVDAPALDVVDTTGAGDSFNAGFLYAWIKGWDLEKTTRLAVACGSQSTLGAGGTASQPTLEVAMAAANLS